MESLEREIAAIRRQRELLDQSIKWRVGAFDGLAASSLSSLKRSHAAVCRHEEAARKRRAESEALIACEARRAALLVPRSRLPPQMASIAPPVASSVDSVSRFDVADSAAARALADARAAAAEKVAPMARDWLVSQAQIERQRLQRMQAQVEESQRRQLLIKKLTEETAAIHRAVVEQVRPLLRPEAPFSRVAVLWTANPRFLLCSTLHLKLQGSVSMLNWRESLFRSCSSSSNYRGFQLQLRVVLLT